MNAPSDKKNNKVVIGIGSNVDQEKNITTALNALEKKYGLLECSPVYKSAAKTNNTPEKNRLYYNLVVSFNSQEDIVTCKQNLREIEAAQGRLRNHADVSCDLDLLLYGETCTTIENIQIPHSDITQCDYVLRPLADLIPEAEHPQLRKNYKHLWQSFAKHTTLEPVDFKWGKTLLSIQPLQLPLWPNNLRSNDLPQLTPLRMNQKDAIGTNVWAESSFVK